MEAFTHAQRPDRTAAQRAGSATIHLDEFAQGDELDLPALANRVGDALHRDLDNVDNPGYVILHGSESRFPDAGGRAAFHRELFALLWADFSGRHADQLDAGARYSCHDADVLDGGPSTQGPVRTSFKDLHSDRRSMLFSHLYGPVTGFTGGEMLIADLRDYMSRVGAQFDDVVEWQVRGSGYGRPVVRSDHVDKVLATSGVNLGAPSSDTIWVVNNAPGSGIFHGVSPTTVVDPATYVRRFIRCYAEADAVPPSPE